MGFVYWCGPGKSTNCIKNKIFLNKLTWGWWEQQKVDQQGYNAAGTSAHSTLECCDTQELLLGGLAAIFIINTFFTGSEGIFNCIVLEAECL